MGNTGEHDMFLWTSTDYFLFLRRFSVSRKTDKMTAMKIILMMLVFTEVCVVHMQTRVCGSVVLWDLNKLLQ